MEKISLKELSRQIMKQWVTVLICLVLSLAFGLFLYKITPPEYQSKVDFFVMNSADESRSRLGSLASVSGINLSVPASGIPNSAIEFVLTSSPFLMDVVKEEFELDNDTVFVGNYLDQSMIIGFKNKMSYLSSKNKTKVLKEQLYENEDNEMLKNPVGNIQIMELRGKLGKSVNILKNSIEFTKGESKPMTVALNLQDPEASAKILKIIIEKLESYINRYSQNNKQDNTDFLKKEVERSQEALYQAQVALANARDENINANKAIANVNVERLNLRYSQAQRTYNDLVMQLEAAKIQVDNTSPLFIIIEPPSVLNIGSPTAPRLTIYVILSIVAGSFISLFVIFIKVFYKRNF